MEKEKKNQVSDNFIREYKNQFPDNFCDKLINIVEKTLRSPEHTRAYQAKINLIYTRRLY